MALEPLDDVPITEDDTLLSSIPEVPRLLKLDCDGDDPLL